MREIYVVVKGTFNVLTGRVKKVEFVERKPEDKDYVEIEREFILKEGGKYEVKYEYPDFFSQELDYKVRRIVRIMLRERGEPPKYVIPILWNTDGETDEIVYKVIVA